MHLLFISTTKNNTQVCSYFPTMTVLGYAPLMCYPAECTGMYDLKGKKEFNWFIMLSFISLTHNVSKQQWPKISKHLWSNIQPTQNSTIMYRLVLFGCSNALPILSLPYENLNDWLLLFLEKCALEPIHFVDLIDDNNRLVSKRNATIVMAWYNNVSIV